MVIRSHTHRLDVLLLASGWLRLEEAGKEDIFYWPAELPRC